MIIVLRPPPADRTAFWGSDGFRAGHSRASQYAGSKVRPKVLTRYRRQTARRGTECMLKYSNFCGRSIELPLRSSIRLHLMVQDAIFYEIPVTILLTLPSLGC